MIDDPMRAEQAKMADAGEQCRRFMDGIGGAAVAQMRESIIEQLTACPPKDDLQRYRLTVALKVVTQFSDTLQRSAVQGEEAGRAVREWLDLKQKRGLWNGG